MVYIEEIRLEWVHRQQARGKEKDRNKNKLKNHLL